VILVLLLAVACAAVAVKLAAGELVGRRGSTALARVAAYGRAESAAIEPGDATPQHGRAAAERIGRMLARLTPGRDRERTLLQLQTAGLMSTRPETFLAVKGAAAATGLALGGLLGASAGVVAAVLFGLLVGALGFVAPDVYLRRRAADRRERILGELPNALDLLAVIVEAGLGFDAALVRYADTAEGPLAEEIRLLATELRVGARADAFKRLATRVDAPETKAFVRSVMHADHLGTSLSGTLRTQAADVRSRRETTAEERANKLPVKILFPTIFCIFPALFLVVLGPPLLNILDGLGS
jgi:tight adherence protein C